jgi:hypothetical protein
MLSTGDLVEVKLGFPSPFNGSRGIVFSVNKTAPADREYSVFTSAGLYSFSRSELVVLDDKE